MCYLFIGLFRQICSAGAGARQQTSLIMQKKEKVWICFVTVYRSQRMVWCILLSCTPEVCRSLPMLDTIFSRLSHSIERSRSYAKYTRKSRDTHYLEHYEENLQANKFFKAPLIFGIQKGRFDLSINVC